MRLIAYGATIFFIIFCLAQVKPEVIEKPVYIDRVVEKNLIKPDPESIIRITEWCTPVMIGGKITLIAEKNESNQPYSYLSASKDFFKSISG